MTTEKQSRFNVIYNNDFKVTETDIQDSSTTYHTNVIYQKLLNFNNLQEKQKKRFSVDDLFKLC